LVVDSQNANIYAQLPKVFNQPVLCLLSASESLFKDTSQGSLFTLFLHSPILGISFIGEITELSAEVSDNCLELLRSLECLTFKELANSDPNSSIHPFLYDDFLRTLCVRFIILHNLLQMHSNTVSAASLPSSSPSFPPDLLNSPLIKEELRKVVELLNIEDKFPKDKTPLTTTE
jgi:hypothetical protein